MVEKQRRLGLKHSDKQPWRGTGETRELLRAWKRAEKERVFGFPSSLHVLQPVWHAFTMSGCDLCFGMLRV